MLGENLKALRTRQGLTQSEIATEMHVVRQTVSKWEQNTSVPDTDQLKKLADLLGTDISSLMGIKIEQDTSETQIANILSGINEQFAVLNKSRRRNTIIISFILIAVFLLIATSLFFNWLN